uniref:P-selectin glycoprotein ligand 1 n=1 Tax=Maylandia zebra TaxID=106582 RepID=A0A3P9CR35_9CICH
MTSVLSSTFSSEKSTAAPGTQNLSSLSVSTARPLTAESISETTRVPQVSTSLPPTTAKTLKTSPEISSATQSVSASSSSISTQSNATSTSTESPNSTIAIIPFPRRPTVLPHPITKPAPATKSPHGEISKSTPSTEVQPCLTQNVVKQCLIVIACLALVCTIFIFTTIVLCAKLSSRKRKLYIRSRVSRVIDLGKKKETTTSEPVSQTFMSRSLHTDGAERFGRQTEDVA